MGDGMDFVMGGEGNDTLTGDSDLDWIFQKISACDKPSPNFGLRHRAA